MTCSRVRLLTLLLVPAGLFAQTRPPAPPPRARPVTVAPPVPNIIVLMVDNLGWQDLSVPLFRDTTAANRRYHTPAIAQLAAEGVSFTDAYASSPVGGLSRLSVMSGRATPLAPGFNSAQLLPRLLKTAGYRTIHIGTTNWDNAGTNAIDAKALGFDESQPGARRADSLTADAIRAMEAARAQSRPFFLYLAYHAVHLPSTGDARFLDSARTRLLDERDAVYASLIAGVDQSVRELTEYLAAKGLAERTIVVLTSDNGGLATAERSGPRRLQNAPLRDGMGSAYEGGLRVPMFVRWPGVARAGFRSATPVVTSDLFPTLLQAARVATMAQATRGVPGRDLASTLNNTKPVEFDRAILWHGVASTNTTVQDVEPFSAIRAGVWKLIYFYQGSRYELYDLSTDIGEGRELSLKKPDVGAKISARLRQSLIDAAVAMPIDTSYRRPFSLPGRLLVPPL